MQNKKQFLGPFLLFFMYSYHLQRLKKKRKKKGLSEQEESNFFEYSDEAQKCLKILVAEEEDIDK